MSRVFKWGTIIFMVGSTAGYFGWIWFTFHLPKETGQHFLRFIIGMGFGFTFGCAMVHWAKDIIQSKQWAETEKELAEHHKKFEEYMKNPPPFRCPDCGLDSRSKEDTLNLFCSFCREPKGHRFR